MYLYRMRDWIIVILFIGVPAEKRYTDVESLVSNRYITARRVIYLSTYLERLEK